MVHWGFPTWVFTILPVYDKPGHSPDTLRTSSALSFGHIKIVDPSVLCQWQDFTMSVGSFMIPDSDHSLNRKSHQHCSGQAPPDESRDAIPLQICFSAVAFTNHIEDCKSHPICRLRTQVRTVFYGVVLFGVPTARGLSGCS